MIVAAVLAAGASRRFGSPKLLARVDGESLLHRATRVAAAWAGRDGNRRAAVILGAYADKLRAEVATGVEIVVNERWNDGLSTSIHTAVHAAGDATALLLTLADQPGITAADLELLTIETTRLPVVAAYNGTRGVPALFPRSDFPALLALRGDTGAKALLADAVTVTMEAARWDVDRPEDVRIA